MCTARAERIAGAGSSTSSKNFSATLIRASRGHGWKKSMAVFIINAGKRRARTRNVSPTGEKQSTTCKLVRTRDIKNSSMASGKSGIPQALASFLKFPSIASISSLANKPDIQPDANIALIYIRNLSSTTCVSVIKNTIGTPLTPANLNISLNASRRSSTLNDPVICNCLTSKLHIYADRRDKLCFPLPPTPISIALPAGL
mmetsp:Transcript_8116/g.12112  ORF Transcript_8116/g.12112 Transcript_8116/m.12112 type:complete len:201 (-) Transcript_8116:4507-5109(-)